MEPCGGLPSHVDDTVQTSARPVDNPIPNPAAVGMQTDEAQKPVSRSPFKGKTGLRRVLNAAGYSWAGLRAAYRHESAFRQELWLGLVLAPLAIYLGESAVERVLMLGSLLLVLIVELLNSAIEASVDRISLEHHLLIKRAKDMGSAAVLLALINVGVVWILLLI